ncbi:hypothetical protein WOSG25_081250 [Weissella oryzae SG25]|uniref:Uncharacterized protein n=1 Tax=Weissella oryzae (strain DSM 25784 / JCM 18191 / LMG 30913 / SG25) TaxID=1329250 RepID=A0A069CVB0_WEIOS|nr:hypothetical protein [Weissella oryzae]GAK31292.1 hypothetical protein WOSG25_081250 [Weissella oryzae SG25]
MTSKGSIKANNFARGANNHGQVSAEAKKDARAALLAKAKELSQKQK